MFETIKVANKTRNLMFKTWHHMLKANMINILTQIRMSNFHSGLIIKHKFKVKKNKIKNKEKLTQCMIS